MESIKELRKICQNKGHEDHIMLRPYRVFTIYITKIFLVLELKPNFVTILSFLIGIMGGYLFLSGHFLSGSIFFLLFYIFDFIDGEIARYLKSCSRLGAWLDITCGHLLYPYFFFTLGLGIFLQTGIFYYAILGSIAAIAKLIERSVPKPQIKTGEQVVVEKDETSTSVKTWASRVAKFTVIFPAILFCSLIKCEIWFLWFYVIYLTFFSLGKIFLTGWRIYSADRP